MKVNCQFFKAAGKSVLAFGPTAASWVGVVASAVQVATYQNKPVEKIDSKNESPSAKR